MRVFLISMLLGLSVASYGQSSIPLNANDAYEYLEQKISEAELLWRKGDAQGIKLLNELLPYLDQTIVRDLAAGNFKLYSERAGIYLSLAEAHAIQGRQRESIDYLEKTATLMESPTIASYLEKNKSFDSIRQTAEFNSVLKKFRKYETYWDSPAMNTAFQENISDSEKIAGLGKFWSEVKYNFAYPEKLLALNWDKLYLEAIPKVLATKSTMEYYQELTKLCIRLADGHTNIILPYQLNPSDLPLRTGLVEGQVMILEVLSDSLKARGIKPGTEILTINGQPTVEYAKQNIEPFQTPVTPQWLEARTFGTELLRGPKERPIRLKLLDALGNSSDIVLERQGYADFYIPPPFEFRMLGNDGIAYVAINDFGAKEVTKLWEQTLPKLLNSKGLILDVRRNGGGSSSIGLAVLRSLVSKPFLTSRDSMPRYNPARRAKDLPSIDWTEEPAEEIQPQNDSGYRNPVVVLAGPNTFSAAEDFLMYWKNSGRGLLIGEPSGGSTGQPVYFRLPGGGSARVCTKRVMFPDGREWVGKGICPDILVHPSLADIKAGKDIVLDKALEHLHSIK
jgi:carboxyl-terminal processing protease